MKSRHSLIPAFMAIEFLLYNLFLISLTPDSVSALALFIFMLCVIFGAIAVILIKEG